MLPAMQITKNFKRSEFACKCGCGADNIDVRLVEALQLVRDSYGRPMRVNSGVRCVAHNKHEGGEKNSYHLKGMAADIHMPDLNERARFMEAVLSVPAIKGIGHYRTFVHLDIRPRAYTWRASY
jgi:uncharacterized protein YcbK (DUF882 family)